MLVPGCKKGFTLLELMIVVAVIGIIVAIAIPNFLRYQTKAKQSEAKMNLKGLFTAEMTYFTENNTFDSNFTEMNWIPVGPCRYAYNAGGANTGLSSLSLSLAINAATPGAGPNGFTAVAWGSISNDALYDTWEITDSIALTNVFDDVNH